MKLVTFLIFMFVSSVKGDLLRTVYCSSRCTDYLRIPEENIPMCLDDHLKMNQCGTVISCSWADVEIEKNRKSANTSEEVVCCYDVQLREKGDCDLQQSTSSSEKPLPTCVSQTTAFFIVIIVLIIVVILETVYIIQICLTQKQIAQQMIGGTIDGPRMPIFNARPVYNVNLLDVEDSCYLNN